MTRAKQIVKSIEKVFPLKSPSIEEVNFRLGQLKQHYSFYFQDVVAQMEAETLNSMKVFDRKRPFSKLIYPTEGTE